MLTRVLRPARPVLAVVILLGAAVFFVRGFQENWSGLQAHRPVYDLPLLLLCLAFFLITTLLGTFGWFLSLSTLSPDRKMTYRKIFAAVNAGGLVKYVPGRIWSFALQTYWLTGAGYSKTLVIFVTIMNLYVSVVATTVLGLVYLVVSSHGGIAAPAALLLLAIVLFDLFFVILNTPVVDWLSSLAGGELKREIRAVAVPVTLGIYLRVAHLLAALASSVGIYLLCAGLGFVAGPGTMLSILSVSLLSDVLGCLAIITPGGLGIREGFMYFFLKGATGVTIALILPLASRLASMISDIVLGSLAIVLLRSSADKLEKSDVHLTGAA